MCDLFSKSFDYMIKNELENISFDDPHIQVVWEDFADNFSSEKIKRVKSYFEKKYGSRNVNVITRIKHNNVDIIEDSENIDVLNKDFQRDLLLKYIEEKDYNNLKNKILEIDDYVNKSMVESELDYKPFNKWYIEKIKFSNFLSFGENQEFKFDNLNGISVIESNPPNFGGKTVLSVDLLMFLFFNTTTKTSKSEEIFNRYSDKDEVVVEGHIKIDGEDFIIVRKLKRKRNRQNNWKVSTSLEFFKKFKDGSLENYTGEQRRETEKFIKKSIGELSDFLMTILTTSSNLENLIDSKPTARAETIARFLGLDNLKIKEEFTRSMVNDFSKSMVSNVFNRFELEEQIKDYSEKVLEYQNLLVDNKKTISDLEKREEKGEDYKKNLIEKKHKIQDFKFFILDTEKNKLSELQKRRGEIIEEKNQVNVKKPNEFFDEEIFDLTVEKIIEINYDIENKSNESLKIKTLIEDFDENSCCEFCGTKLSTTQFFEDKTNKIQLLDQEISSQSTKLEELISKKDHLSSLRTQFNDYERNKLIFENFLAQEESLSLRIENQNIKINSYYENQDKIEENKKIEELIIKSDLRLNEIQTEINNMNYENVRLDGEINNIQEKIIDNKKTIEKIDKENEKLKILKIYSEIFGKNGISKQVMRSMLPVINNELQRILTDCANFNLEVTMSEKNEVMFTMIDHNIGIRKPLESGSGFEKTISSIALRSVLSKICSLPKPNVIVFDEVFGKISNENLENTFEIFRKIKSYFENILIITHNPLISQWADGIVQITKKDNISRLL